MDQVVDYSPYRPKPSDLIAFLPFACHQLDMPFHLRILVEISEEHVGKASVDDKRKKSKRDKITPQTETASVENPLEKEPSVDEQVCLEEDEVLLVIRCEPGGKPVELLFHRCNQVPRLLIKIIGLCIPYHQQLAKITFRWHLLDGSILYEIAKFLPLSHITEICLDDSPVSHRNYYLLLERPTGLCRLSLARCGLTDEVCTALATRLMHPLPASRSLKVLCLESNRITDVGAHALGKALRTNRSLRHLNLAGNAITSIGAAHIFRSLAQFPVSFDELVEKRRRAFNYVALRREAYAKCYDEIIQSADQALEDEHGYKRTVRGWNQLSAKDSGVDALAARAEAMAAELVGVHSDPFDPGELVRRGDAVYCVGNFSLSYLNLAYNGVDCTGVARLVEVLAYQATAGLRAGPGLLRAVLEGNVLPATCQATRAVEALLERSLPTVGTHGLQLKPGRKSDRTKAKA